MKHGWAHCSDNQCICDAGYCSTDGVTCVAEEAEPSVGEEQSEESELLSGDFAYHDPVSVLFLVASVVALSMATLGLVFVLVQRRQRHQLAEPLVHEH